MRQQRIQNVKLGCSKGLWWSAVSSPEVFEVPIYITFQNSIMNFVISYTKQKKQCVT